MKIDVTDGLKFDDFDKLEELNNLNINVFELIEEEVSIQLYVSENNNKDVVNVNDEINQMTNHEDKLEDIQLNIHEDSQLDNCKAEYENCFAKNRETT